MYTPTFFNSLLESGALHGMHHYIKRGLLPPGLIPFASYQWVCWRDGTTPNTFRLFNRQHLNNKFKFVLGRADGVWDLAGISLHKYKRKGLL